MRPASKISTRFTPLHKDLAILEATPSWSLLRLPQDVILWRSRDNREVWIGIGTYFESPSLTECLKALSELGQAEQATQLRPRCFGAVSFDPKIKHRGAWEVFPSEWFWIPDYLIRWSETSVDAIRIGEPDIQIDWHNVARQSSVAFGAHSETTNFSRLEWRNAIDHVKDHIRHGKLRKAVLARQTEVNFDAALEPAAIVSRLALYNPHSFIFGLKKKNHVFAGASPECLFQLTHNRLSVDSLAGTRPINTNSEFNQTMAQELIASDKEREEHQAVTDYLNETLQKLCTGVEFDQQLHIKQFSTLQHLSAALSGNLRSDIPIETVLRTLHPTPAVCGTPLEAARTLIHELEPDARGLFSGAIGWATEDEAEFAVAIRSALLKGKTATLFAGAGIVANADADQEYDECSLKMETVRRALNPS